MKRRKTWVVGFPLIIIIDKVPFSKVEVTYLQPLSSAYSAVRHTTQDLTGNII